MSKEPTGPVYGGLTGLRLPAEPVHLGHGVMLTATYAHIACPYMMAFAPPEHPGAHHPGPWKTPGVSSAYDITAQLAIPESVGKSSAERARAALIIVFAMRMWCDPAIALPVASTVPFSELAATPDEDAQITTLEISERRFRLGIRNPDHRPLDGLHDVAAHWMTAYTLYEQSSEFQLATDALTTGQFVGNSALLMVSLWGALEAIFSPSTSELRFRVSSLIASYLYPPGPLRAAKQDEIAKLYDKRSAAAHGRPKHLPADVVATFQLLRNVLIRILQDGKVPTKEELNWALFGGDGGPDRNSREACA